MDRPTWDELEKDIRQMNGQDKSFVQLGGPDSTCMWVSGGNNERFLVEFMHDMETQSTSILVDNSMEGPPVQIVTAGVLDEYPARFGVRMTSVLDAFRSYYALGKFPKHLNWESSSPGETSIH